MIGIDKLIPGEKEAAEKFRTEQILSFAGVEPDIGAVAVKPFTPAMFIDLEIGESGFFGGRSPGPSDLAVMLWRVSEAYERGNAAKRTQFNYFVGMMNHDEAMTGCFDYLRRAWLAMPEWPGSKGGPKSVGIWPSRLVHMFGTEYGWLEEYTLNLPFRRLWQYANRILESNSDRYVQKAPGVRSARADWLKEENRRLRMAPPK